MAIPQTFTLNWTDGSNVSALISTPVVSPTGAVYLDASIAATTTNEEHVLALTVADMTGLYILATGALTLKTNSTGSPDNTIVLVANQPVVWLAGGTGYPANPLTANTTVVYITNAGEAAVQVSIRAAYTS